MEPPVNLSRETNTASRPEIVSTETVHSAKKLGRPRKLDIHRSCLTITGKTDRECTEREAVEHLNVDVKMEEDSELSDSRWLGPGDTIEDVWRRYKREIESIDRGSSVQKSGFMMNQCSECPRSFSEQLALRKHQERVHKVKMDLVDGGFVCETCGSRFAFQINLKHHVKNDHLRLSHACGICPRLFPTPHCAALHRNVDHAQRVLVACPICAQMFRTVQAMRGHARYKHSNDETRTYTCAACGEAFSRCEELESHERTEHEGWTEESAAEGGP